MRRMVLFGIAMFIASMSLAPASHAGLPTDSVKSTIDKVIAVLKDPDMKAAGKEDARQKKITSAIYEVFDFEEMAKRSLARYWNDRTPAEKKEFTDLFAGLLECSYIARIESYSDEKIVYDGEKVEDDYAVVKTRFITSRREEIAVDYKLLKEGGKWNVYDVVIEGVSLVNNYRIQFNKIIRDSSYQGLVNKMKTKAEAEAIVCPAIPGI